MYVFYYVLLLQITLYIIEIATVQKDVKRFSLLYGMIPLTKRLVLKVLAYNVIKLRLKVFYCVVLCFIQVTETVATLLVIMYQFKWYSKYMILFQWTKSYTVRVVTYFSLFFEHSYESSLKLKVCLKTV